MRSHLQKDENWTSVAYSTLEGEHSEAELDRCAPKGNASLTGTLVLNVTSHNGLQVMIRLVGGVARSGSNLS
jgi:hypothetical protein